MFEFPNTIIFSCSSSFLTEMLLERHLYQLRYVQEEGILYTTTRYNYSRLVASFQTKEDLLSFVLRWQDRLYDYKIDV